jgi:dihydrofolate synthase/folylpolyglutamate synthase
MLSTIYATAGYRVGAYTSPHISDFRERIRIDGRMADARAIVEALSFVESGRAPQTLTYFEYTTLAAMQVFLQAGCDVVILEVGLGGRLDATNIWDADCAVVTSIALDHQDYLGSDVSVIATEKAAIGRSGRTLVLGEPEPPESIFEFTARKGIRLLHVGRESLDSMPQSSLQGAHQRRNAACAAAVVSALGSRLPVDPAQMQTALNHTVVDARFERREIDGVSVVLDVAHNPAGAVALCHAWREAYGSQQAEIVFAALADKDLEGIIQALDPIVARWHCIALEVHRGTPLDQLMNAVRQASDKPLHGHEHAADAWQSAHAAGIAWQRPVLVAGSFHTIAAMLEVMSAPDSILPGDG